MDKGNACPAIHISFKYNVQLLQQAGFVLVHWCHFILDKNHACKYP